MKEVEQRIIVTVIGKDKIGIIAAVANAMAEANVNILDINQTRMQGLFTMFLVADISESKLEFSELTKRLEQVGEQIGLKITAQREDVFNFMHRI